MLRVNVIISSDIIFININILYVIYLKVHEEKTTVKNKVYFYICKTNIHFNSFKKGTFGTLKIKLTCMLAAFIWKQYYENITNK